MKFSIKTDIVEPKPKFYAASLLVTGEYAMQVDEVNKDVGPVLMTNEKRLVWLETGVTTTFPGNYNCRNLETHEIIKIKRTI